MKFWNGFLGLIWVLQRASWGKRNFYTHQYGHLRLLELKSASVSPKEQKKTLQVCICWRNKIWYPTSTHPFESPSRIRSFFTKSFTLSSYRDCNCFFCNMNQFFIIYVLHLNLESTVQEKLRRRNAINSTKNEPQTNRNKLHVYNKILKKLTVSIWFK